MLTSTDLIVTPNDLSPVEKCTGNILVWILFMLTILILSIWIAVKRTSLHLQRENKRLAPFMVVLSWLSTVVVVLFLILPFVGVNANNGGTLVLLALEMIVFNCKIIFFLQKLIRLGKKIIPLSSKFMPEGDNTSATFLDLSRVNGIISSMFALCWTISVGEFICWCILSYVVSSGDKIVVIKVAFGLKAVFLFVACGCLIYQLQRCINVIWPTDKIGLNNDQIAQLMRTIRKMRRQQIIVWLLALPSIVLYILLSIGIIPLHYSVIIVVISLDVVGNALMVRSQARPSKSRLDNQPEPVNAATITTISSGGKETA
jgi:hypothetical protein